MMYTSKRDNAANVRELQEYLRYISRHTDGVPYVNADGVFGTKTEAAVSELQRRFGLPVTGTADLPTWAAVTEEYRSLQRSTRTPVPVHVFPPELPYMSEGDDFDEVFVLQVMLRRMGRIYQNIGDVEINGTFDAITAAAVNDFKSCCTGLEADGRVDRETWNLLSETYSAFTHND